MCKVKKEKADTTQDQADSLACTVLVWVNGVLLATPPSTRTVKAVHDRFTEGSLWLYFVL